MCIDFKSVLIHVSKIMDLFCCCCCPFQIYSLGLIVVPVFVVQEVLI